MLALLIGWWPSARAVYPAVFRAQAGALFARGDPPAIQLRPASGADLAQKDTFVEAYADQGAAPRWRIGISSLRLGYWPMAVLLALLLATPMSAARRALAVGVGLVWLDAFALGRLGLDIERAFGELASRGGSEDASGALLAYRTASQVLNSNIVVIAAVLLGWAAVARPRRALAWGSLGRVLDRGAARRPG